MPVGSGHAMPATGHNRAPVSVEHYENFPVASWLCPPELRPPITAIYHFARTADDIADEGDATAAERRDTLNAYRLELVMVANGEPPSIRWAKVFEPLAKAMHSHRLPVPALDDLLDAFLQDTGNPIYPDRDSLQDYCRRSANPVGRLLLHLYGIDDHLSLRQSDAICTALQLINFWQDLSVDLPRGRRYVPQSDAAHHGLDTLALCAGPSTAAERALVRDLCQWAERLMRDGAPLVHTMPGRSGWELRMVVQGGLRILEKIAAMDHDTLLQRPALTPGDGLPMLWRAATAMRRASR